LTVLALFRRHDSQYSMKVRFLTSSRSTRAAGSGVSLKELLAKYQQFIILTFRLVRAALQFI
jgi:hypothetical protein